MMDPGQVCLIGALIGDGCVWAVQLYVIWGFVLFIMGILMASFIPLPAGKKLGLGLTLVGLVLMIALPMLVNLWKNNVGFQIAVYSAIVFIGVMMILFPKRDEVLPTK